MRRTHGPVQLLTVLFIQNPLAGRFLVDEQHARFHGHQHETLLHLHGAAARPALAGRNGPGGGLGLFLVVNVARTLGGSVAARNRPEGGAVVTITLPLAAITLEEEDEEDQDDDDGN